MDRRRGRSYARDQRAIQRRGPWVPWGTEGDRRQRGRRWRRRWGLR
jgi:hypothetical protein